MELSVGPDGINELEDIPLKLGMLRVDTTDEKTATVEVLLVTPELTEELYIMDGSSAMLG